MNSRNFISVICPVYNEKAYITGCIESILAQDYPHDLLEVLFVDGLSTDNTRDIITAFARKHNFLKLLDNPDNNVSYALNLGIKASIGDIIIRIDAHCSYPANYFSSLIDNLISLNADNVGGIIKTNPANSSAIARAIATAMSHPFGVGNSFFRIGCKNVKEVDTVPFGCFRRKLFDQIGFFDTDMVRNQDDEFNARIIKNGGKIYLIPGIEITYFSRERISKVRQMFFQYGFYKPLISRKLGSPATLRQFIPLLFVFGILLGALISPFVKSAQFITISLIAIYILCSFIFAIIESIRQRDFKYLLLLPVIFIVIHVSYGWGYIIGILNFFLLGKKTVSLNVNR